MSVSLWAYQPIACDDEFCVGDCDLCKHRPVEDWKAELVDKKTFCDDLRNWMSARCNPMSIDITEHDAYNAYIDTWWYIDHYCEREPPRRREEETCTKN